MAELSPLVEHYVSVVGLIESRVMCKIPRIPFVPVATGLSNCEVLEIAELMALGHEIHDRLAERGAA